MEIAADQDENQTVDFSERELRYLMDRSLGRLGFVCGDMIAHVMPVLFEFDGTSFYLSGWNLKYSERFRSIPDQSTVTLVIDDLTGSSAWLPRGIEVTGIAESYTRGDYLFVRIRPSAKNAWGFSGK